MAITVHTFLCPYFFHTTTPKCGGMETGLVSGRYRAEFSNIGGLSITLSLLRDLTQVFEFFDRVK